MIVYLKILVMSHLLNQWNNWQNNSNNLSSGLRENYDVVTCPCQTTVLRHRFTLIFWLPINPYKSCHLYKKSPTTWSIKDTMHKNSASLWQTSCKIFKKSYNVFSLKWTNTNWKTMDKMPQHYPSNPPANIKNTMTCSNLNGWS